MIVKKTKRGVLEAIVVEQGDDPLYEIPGVNGHDGPVRVRQSEIDSVRRRSEQYLETTRFAHNQGD